MPCFTQVGACDWVTCDCQNGATHPVLASGVALGGHSYQGSLRWSLHPRAFRPFAGRADVDIVYTVKPVWASFQAYMDEVQADGAFQVEDVGEHIRWLGLAARDWAAAYCLPCK